jgi:hypothetical protein
MGFPLEGNKVDQTIDTNDNFTLQISSNLVASVNAADH